MVYTTVASSSKLPTLVYTFTMKTEASSCSGRASTQLQPNTRVIGAGPESHMHRYHPGVIEKVQDPEPGS